MIPRMRTRRATFAGLGLLSAVLLSSAPAAAQGEGGVARSGMGQGEAAISTRADVRMGIESGPGTTGSKLQAMAGAIGGAMNEVRRCYTELAEERPDVTGAMSIRVSLRRGRGRVQLEVDRDTTEDAGLARCVRRAIERATYRAVRRPAFVTISLDFTNSAAAGAEAVRERRAVEDTVAVRRTGDGTLEATGGNASGEVRFRIRSHGRTGEAAVAAVQRGVRAAIPGMLDCRRRAGRRGMNPEGEMVIELRVARRGRARTRTIENAVQDSRAPTCVSRVLSRARLGQDAAGTTRVHVRFAPRRVLDVPVRGGSER